MTQQKATREQLEQFKKKVEQEIQGLREQRERARALQEKNERIIWNREFHDLLESPEGIARIKRLAAEWGVPFDEAMIRVAERELPEPPAHYYSGVRPEDAAIDRAAKRYAEEQGVSYGVALEAILDGMPDTASAAQLSEEPRSRDAEEGLIHSKALKLSEAEGIPYLEAFEKALSEAEGR